MVNLVPRGEGWVGENPGNEVDMQYGRKGLPVLLLIPAVQIRVAVFWERYVKMVPFLSKMVNKRVREWTLGHIFLVLKFP